MNRDDFLQSKPEGSDAPLPLPDPKCRVLILDHTAILSGGEVALARTVAELVGTETTIHLVLAEDGPLAEIIRGQGHEVTILPLSPSVTSIRKGSLDRRLVSKLKSALLLLPYCARVTALAKSWNADVIQSNSLKSAVYGVFVSKLARIPLIWHVRDTIDSSYLPMQAVKFIRRLARWGPAYIVTNSWNTLRSLELPLGWLPENQDEALGRRSGVVYDGLRLEEFPQVSVNGRSIRRIAVVGRLSEWKGQHVFIAAAKALLDRKADCEFLIAGSPMFGEEAYAERLRGQVECAGLNEHVRFLGFVEDIPSFLQTVDLLVHCSVSPEPFGQVIVEGMACGLPVIATSLGGPLEIINHGVDGFLVPPGDVDELAECILKLVQDPARAYIVGERGRESVRDRFTSAVTSRHLRTLYHSIVHTRSRGK